jgi:hypothetical protein
MRNALQRCPARYTQSAPQGSGVAVMDQAPPGVALARAARTRRSAAARSRPLARRASHCPTLLRSRHRSSSLFQGWGKSLGNSRTCNFAVKAVEAAPPLPCTPCLRAAQSAKRGQLLREPRSWERTLENWLPESISRARGSASPKSCHRFTCVRFANCAGRPGRGTARAARAKARKPHGQPCS